MTDTITATSPRFRLDIPKAVAWLDRVVAANDNDESFPAENIPEGIDGAWRPALAEGREIEELVAVAFKAGLIAPLGGDATIAFEFLDGGEHGDDAGRFLVTVDSSFTLASPSAPLCLLSDLDTAGAANALSVLRTAEAVANSMLHRLDRWAGAR